MRSRRRKWTNEELTESPLIKTAPALIANKGGWREFFNSDAPIFLEIGAGKGRFACETAIAGDCSVIAFEREGKIAVYASRLARLTYASPKNLIIANANAENLAEYFAPSEVSRIFINFCDPWEGKHKWAKKRLTYRGFLAVYAQILAKGGTIAFKTDNHFLFTFTLGEIEAQSAFVIRRISENLHAEEYAKDLIMTEYETKFTEKGQNIYYIEAELKNF
ncbi:tRNA (guanine-N(7)-)-methyltransferase [Clostridia bacterium]|nr:tRNA (guanine-N(7)-)-methyltransferase [Clostridia bacterium]